MPEDVMLGTVVKLFTSAAGTKKWTISSIIG